MSVAAIKLWPRPAGGDKYTPTSDLGLEEFAGLESDRAANGRYLMVTIDWDETGRSIPKEIITHSIAAETMARFVGRLITVLGDEATSKLSQLRVSRGPLLTRDPKRDFLNSAKGTLYAHKQVPGTDLYILTHSDTKQKLKDMRRASDLLGMSQAVRIDLADILTETTLAPE